MVTELCVADSAAPMPASHDGKPIVVHLRMQNLQQSTELGMQPETLRIGGQVDTGAFERMLAP